jgi:tetratricopeptide (TPR) repeat protein
VARREAEKAFVLTDFAFTMIEASSRETPSSPAGRPAADSWLAVAEQQARSRLRLEPDTGAAMLRDVARLHLARNDLDAAARLLEETLVIQGSAQDLGPFERAETLRLLGKLASLRGEPETAAERYAQALELFEATTPGESIRAAHTVIDLGNAFLSLNRLEPAAEAYRRAIDLMGSNDADPQWGRARNNLGLVAMRRHDWALAARLMGEALPNVERSLDESDHQLGEFLVTYASVLRHLGVSADARRLASRGSSILERTLPPEDPRRVEGLELVKVLGPP